MLFPLFILLGHGGSTILLFRGAFLFFHHLLQRFIVLSQHFTAFAKTHRKLKRHCKNGKSGRRYQHQHGFFCHSILPLFVPHSISLSGCFAKFSPPEQPAYSAFLVIFASFLFLICIDCCKKTIDTSPCLVIILAH